MVTKKTDISKPEAAVPIEWYVPDEGLMTPFATNMVIQTIENVFKISFFEIKPSIRLDASQPLPDKIRADRVASVIVDAGRLSTFIDVLQKHLDKYKSKKQEE
ncbi:MAG: hypothetical protein FP814_12210 [Desulfobacterium sp.]|nr:hypothetical protein [Desulfobacterium sp.]